MLGYSQLLSSTLLLSLYAVGLGYNYMCLCLTQTANSEDRILELIPLPHLSKYQFNLEAPCIVECLEIQRKLAQKELDSYSRQAGKLCSSLCLTVSQ